MVKSASFGRLADGREVTKYILQSDALRVTVLDRGCVLQAIEVRDNTGLWRNILLHYDTAADYAVGTALMGELVGRVANRIRGSRFLLNGTMYQLQPNEKENHNHGNYGQVFYRAESGEDQVTFSRISPAGEEGYPGAISLRVTFRLRENRLELVYDAMSDADTLLNLTHHTYFNLSGEPTIAHHQLAVHADSYTPTDDALCPTGVIRPVSGPLDLRAGRTLGSFAYDHNFVLSGGEWAATLFAPDTGIRLRLATSQPGLQVYTGAFLGDDPVGRYRPLSGVALEAQHFPDAPSHPNFPSIVLRAGQRYHETTTYEITAGG